MIPTWVVVLTSAVVGAVVSNVIVFIGQERERQARRRELLLTKAIELAVIRRDLFIKGAEATGKTVHLRPEISMAAEYFNALQKLIRDNVLPEKMVEEEAQSLAEALAAEKAIKQRQISDAASLKATHPGLWADVPEEDR